MFGIAVMLLVRSFFEVDVLHPYVVGSFLLYYAAGLLASPQLTRALPSGAEASPAPHCLASRRMTGVQCAVDVLDRNRFPFRAGKSANGDSGAGST